MTREHTTLVPAHEARLGRPVRSSRAGRPSSGPVLVVAVVGVLALTLAAPSVAGDVDRTVAAPFSPPTDEHLLGTDVIGRDVLDRLLAGGAGLVLVAAFATLVAVLVGTVLGMATIHRGRPARVVSGALDVVLIVPSMLTMLVLIFGLGPGTATMVVVVTAVSAPFVARYVRALAGPMLESDFVLAARGGGADWLRVLATEVLPGLLGPLAADAGARYVGSLYLVASAAFLGLDPLGTDVDWASMVQTGLEGISLNPWACLAPALAIAAVTVPSNLLVDRLLARGAR